MEGLKNGYALARFSIYCRLRRARGWCRAKVKRLARTAFIPMPVKWVSRRGGRTALGRKFPRIRVGLFWAHCHFAKSEGR